MPEFEIPSGNEFIDQDMDYESMLSFFDEALIKDLGDNFQSDKDDDTSDHRYGFHGIEVYSDSYGGDPAQEIVDALKNEFVEAWKESFTKFKKGKSVRTAETGAVIIKRTQDVEINGEVVHKTIYELHNYKVSNNDYIRINYSGIPEDAEVVGEFHTHPYSDKSSDKLKKWQPNIDQSDVPFSGGDFDAYASKISQGKTKEGHVLMVVTEKSVYGIVIKDSEKAKKFLGNSGVQDQITDYGIDMFQGYSNPEGDQSMGDALWQNILNVQSDYENELNTNSGVEFVRIDITPTSNEKEEDD